MPTKSAAAQLGSGERAIRRWATVAVAGTTNAFVEFTAWRGITLSIGGGLEVPRWGKKLDAIKFGGASNSLGLGASVQNGKLSGACQTSYILGPAYGGQLVTGGLAGTPPVDYPTSIKLTGNRLRLDNSVGPIDIGEFMGTMSVRYSDEPAAVDMRYRSAILSSATKAADLALVAAGTETTFPYTIDENTQGVRQSVVSAAQDALALGAVAFGGRLAGDGLVESDQDIGGPAGGGQVVTSMQYGVAPSVQDEWMETKNGSIQPNGVATAGTGAALSVCAVGICLGFQMKPQ